jgi:UDP-GlcNAc:undecaprenyl-phosphate/decaprenyl-phosphate GlcNAc-1-phosphate transferase
MLHFLSDIPVRLFSWDEVLSPYVYVFYVAFAVAFVFTPLMRLVALQFGIVDAPDRRRKMHGAPVAYLGGVAVFLGWIAGIAISQFLRLHSSEGDYPAPLVMKFSIVSGASIIVILGLWDDIVGLRPYTKIIGQIAAAVFLLWEGIGTHCSAPILDPIGRILNVKLGIPLIPEWAILVSSSALVVMVVVGCCNASNLIDGLDGLCGGVTAVIAAGFLFIAVHLAMNSGGLNSNWDGQRVVLGLALLGAVLGFVPFNFNPASIFMGDTGSMFLGYACAVMIILMGQGQHPKWFLASMIMFALPILDTALAFARRWVKKRPLFGADTYHFHHQLLSRGFTVKQTVMISYGLAIFFALMGASIVLMRTRFAAGFWLIIFSWIAVAAYKMGMIHERPRVVLKTGDVSSGAVTADVAEVEPSKVLEVSDAKSGTNANKGTVWEKDAAAESEADEVSTRK